MGKGEKIKKKESTCIDGLVSVEQTRLALLNEFQTSLHWSSPFNFRLTLHSVVNAVLSIRLSFSSLFEPFPPNESIPLHPPFFSSAFSIGNIFDRRHFYHYSLYFSFSLISFTLTDIFDRYMCISFFYRGDSTMAIFVD